MGQPAPMRQRPMTAAAVNPAVPKQEGKQLLELAAKVIRRRLAGPHEIARRLVRRVWRMRLTVSVPTRRSRASVTASRVRLHPLARPFPDQGRSDRQTIVAERPDLAIEPGSRRPGCEADVRSHRSASLLIVRSTGPRRSAMRWRRAGVCRTAALTRARPPFARPAAGTRTCICSKCFIAL